MNDNDELRARSVELAQRALRLRDRADDNATKEGLHAAADELIILANSTRFYTAQSALEKQNHWREDQRSLAHELNVADRAIRGSEYVSLEETMDNLRGWAANYAESSRDELLELGATLRGHLNALRDIDDCKETKTESLNYLITFLEAMLQHASEIDPVGEDPFNSVVALIRAMRDSLLVARELTYDEETLLSQYQKDGAAIDRLSIARHNLEELYQIAK